MGESDTTYIRPSAVAGSFYPGSPTELVKMIAELFSESPKPLVDGKPLAIIAPHAGYIYSGAIAAKAYKILEGEEISTVVIISPSHTVYFKGVAAFDGQAYSTPLGNIPIDRELTKSIAQGNTVYLSNQGHGSAGGRAEHALEVQLPFLQTVIGKFRLVALVMGDQEYATCEALGTAIADAIGKRNDVLIVASTDLSHFHSADTARKLDSIIKHRIEEFDYRSLADDLDLQKTEACGGGPVIAAMIACDKLGANAAKVTGFGDSGDASGDKSNVVGYLSAVLYRPAESTIYEISEAEEMSPEPLASPSKGSAADFGLSDSDKKTLLAIARESIRARLQGKAYEISQPPKSLRIPAGAFVTLHLHGELRGCIGTFRDFNPVFQIVSEMACQAAFSDYRFSPVSPDELDSIDIEISVLTPMKRIYDPESVEVGRDGLYIIKGSHSGVLLPQVPVEEKWDRDTFLSHTCLKAGLPRNSWKDKETELYVFQAEIFGER